MGAGTVAYSVDAGLARVRLSRSEARNALSFEMLAGISSALDRCAADSRVNAVLLDAEGPAFCAGMDLRTVRLEDPNEAERFARALSLVYRRLVFLEIPLFCAVDGAAVGGGVGLALAADLVWVGPRARLVLPEVRLGIVPALVSVLVTRRVAPKRAAGILLQGTALDPCLAMSLGLADRRAEELASADAETEARRILRENSPGAMRKTKDLLSRALGAQAFDADLERAERAFCEAVASSDARRGLEAYRSGEVPRWSDDDA